MSPPRRGRASGGGSGGALASLAVSCSIILTTIVAIAGATASATSSPSAWSPHGECTVFLSTSNPPSGGNRDCGANRTY